MAEGGPLLFASESVTEGHPDKLCDRVADAVLDACLAGDPEARVSCEAVTKTSMVMLLGEVVTKAPPNYEQVIREAVKSIGYDSDDKGLDWRTMNVIVAVEEQSPDLAQALSASKANEEAGTGDQGIVFGYATNESAERAPVSHLLASKLCAQMDRVRKDGTLPWLRPSGRAQVVMEYREEPDGSVVPVRVQTVSLSAQHSSDARPEQVEKDLMEHVVKTVVPEGLCDSATAYHLSPSKQAQPSDTGLAGRKPAADTYGGWGSLGGAVLSGKDASKVSRAGSYAARWAAKSLVEAQLCKRCSVQLSYIAGQAQPASVHVCSYGSGQRASGKSDAQLADIVTRSFDLRISSLQRELHLKTPQFQKLSAYGHFGRDLEPKLTWEQPKELR